MDISGFIGYFNYITFLFLTTGGLTLWLDVIFYKKRQMKREKRAASLSGWINVVLGTASLVGSWLYRNYIW